MSGRLEGKVAVVTGGSSGIGEASALRFGREGAKVVIGNRRVEEGEATVAKIREAGGEADFVQCDVKHEDQIAALIKHAVEKYGRLDIAFNNAGVDGDMGPLHEQSIENYDHVFDINVKGLFLCMQHEVRQMLAQDNPGGSIVNTSSVAGVVGFQGATVYDASKHAVMGLTRTAALEYAEQGIRINAVNPGAIETAMIDRIAEDMGITKNDLIGFHPIGRLGKSEEISDAVLWLASDESSFVTGTALMVDGGFTAR